MITIKTTIVQLLLPLVVAANFSLLWTNVDKLTPVTAWKYAGHKDLVAWGVVPPSPGEDNPRAWANPGQPQRQGEPASWDSPGQPQGEEGTTSWGNDAEPQPGDPRGWERENNLVGEEQQPQGWNVYRKSQDKHTDQDYQDYLKFKEFLLMKKNLAW